jgi:probable rRNA maturation factor
MRLDTDSLSVVRKTKGKLPSLPFEDLKTTILGKKYELSMVFIGDIESQKLNSAYRQKNYPTNILSFPLSETSGEIFINLKKVRVDAPLFEKNYSEFLLQIVIHGMVHLRGLDHGLEMDKLEAKYWKKFNI